MVALAPLDAAAVRRDFPILDQEVHGYPLVYLDNAATTQKPRVVIDALTDYYEHYNSNVHRGVHALSEQATTAMEAARDKVRRFVGAGDTREIVFTRGTTESINLVASSFGRLKLGPGDQVLITEMEHHSNIVPWQLICEQTGAELAVAPMTDEGALDLDGFVAKLTDRTKLVAAVHVSNALGTVNPVAKLVELAHERGIPVLLDGAQALSHLPVDVQELDVDFYAFSGHKVFGPTGIGALYAKADWLEALPPYQGGGDMIRRVSFAGTTFNDIPFKFEAGTPNIAGAIGLGAAADYVEGLGRDRIAAHEAQLLRYGTERLLEIEGLRLIGTAPEKAAVMAFELDGIHPHDIGTLLDRQGVAIRAGHHCAQPVMDHYGVAATARASLAAYNTTDDIDRLVHALHKAVELFR